MKKRIPISSHPCQILSIPCGMNDNIHLLTWAFHELRDQVGPVGEVSAYFMNYSGFFHNKLDQLYPAADIQLFVDSVDMILHCMARNKQR